MLIKELPPNVTSLSLPCLLTQSQQEEEEEEEDVQYASVKFSQNHQRCIYSNVTAARPRIQEDEEEVVEYSVVRVKGVRAAQR